jgi:hypothetical protein
MISLLILVPYLSFSSVHQVAIGTTQNKLSFLIKNSSTEPLKKISVRIVESPDFLHFTTTEAKIESVPANGGEDTEFFFNVLNGEANRNGSVKIEVEDGAGKTLAMRYMEFQTVLQCSQNTFFPAYPNPANASVVLPYAVVEPCRVRLEICDLLGRRVAVLLEEDKTAGQWSATWDGRDERGMISPSGVYIARLQTMVKGKTELITKKLLMQR